MRSTFKPQALTIKAIIFVFLAICSGMGRGYAADLIYLNSGNTIYTYDVSQATSLDVLNSKTVFTTTGYLYGRGITLDSAGNVYGGSAEAGPVFKYSSTGVLQKTIGNSSVLDGVKAMALDSTGNLFSGNASMQHPIAEFNNSGSFLGYSSVYSSQGLAIDSSNNFYVVSGQNIEKYNSTGNLLTTFALGRNLTGLTIDSSGNLYVCDESNWTIVKLDSTGKILQTIGDSTNLWSPQFITLDSKGNIYATGNGGYIAKFNSSGAYQFKWNADFGGLATLPVSVPEPSTYALAVIASGVLAVAARRRRGRKV